MFYLVHPDTKKLMDVTFIVAVNDDSVLLSCNLQNNTDVRVDTTQNKIGLSTTQS